MSDSSKIKLSDIVKYPINVVDFPAHKYVKEIVDKRQIVWHATSSGPGTRGDLQHWLSSTQRISTAIIIERDGSIDQVFSSKFWAHHLGVSSKVFKKHVPEVSAGIQNLLLNKSSISIELDSWGPLKAVKVGDETKYAAWPNKWGEAGKSTYVDAENVIKLDEPWRGFEYFERYTEAQIEAAKQLTIFWALHYNINVSTPAPIDRSKINECLYNKLFEVNNNALRNVQGVYTHASYRSDKFDCSPQQSVVSAMLEIEAEVTRLRKLHNL